MRSGRAGGRAHACRAGKLLATPDARSRCRCRVYSCAHTVARAGGEYGIPVGRLCPQRAVQVQPELLEGLDQLVDDLVRTEKARSALRASPCGTRWRNSSFAGCLGTRVPLSCRRTYGCRGSLVYPSDMCACFPSPEATTSPLSPRTMDDSSQREVMPVLNKQ